MKGLTKALLSLWLRTRAEAAHTKLLFWPENQASCLPDDNGKARSIHAVTFKYTSWTLHFT